MSRGDTILVIGATGAMGRPVVKALLADADRGWRVRAFTRDPDSEQARALRGLAPDRVEFAAGDVNDPKSLDAAVRGAYGVFCNTNFWSKSPSVEAEYDQGIRALEAAKRAGVRHFVYSALDGMAALSDGQCPCPHFDSKAAVAAHIDRRRSDDFMRAGRPGFDGDDWYLRRTSVLVTLPYTENFKQIFAPKKGRLSDGREGVVFEMPLGDAPWPMVALDDIAAFAAAMFARPEEWAGRTLRVGSDSLPMREVAATFTRVTGIPAEYRPVPPDEFAKQDMPNLHDIVNFFAFVRDYRLPRDHAALRKIHPGLRSFEAWLRETGWRGEPEDVQKDPVTG